MGAVTVLLPHRCDDDATVAAVVVAATTVLLWPWGTVVAGLLLVLQWQQLHY